MSDTSRSVRNWEPKLALVPEPNLNANSNSNVEPQDVFYERLLGLFRLARAKVLVLEVGDEGQAERVVGIVGRMQKESGMVGWRWGVEVWRDWMGGVGVDGEEKKEVVVLGGVRVRVRGVGRMRVVVVRAFERVWGRR